MRKFTGCKPLVLVAFAMGIAALPWTNVLRASEARQIRMGVSPLRTETTSAGWAASIGRRGGEKYQAPSNTDVKGTVEKTKATQPADPLEHQSGAVRIGVLAKRGAERCLQKWGPTAEYLTEEIPAYSFTIVPLGYDDLLSTVGRGDVDFVLANSAFYVQLEVLHGVSRMATLKNLHASGPSTCYGGVIFCKADRQDIKDFCDLEGSIRLEDFRVLHDSDEHHLSAGVYSTRIYPEWPLRMGREDRVLEMKQEVNDLPAQLGRERKYENV